MSNIVLILIYSSLFCLAKTSRIITYDEFQQFVEQLLIKDNDEISKKVKVNLQRRTNFNLISKKGNEKGVERLINVNKELLNYPSIKHLIALYNNYDPDVTKEEIVTAEHSKKISTFLNAVLQTDVMNYTMQFLKKKGLLMEMKIVFKTLLNRIWFKLYSRGYKQLSSSAFEHVFMGEIKNNQVSGFHNWIYFYNQEENNNLKYLGWLKVIDFGKGKLLKINFLWKGYIKRAGSLLVGTSPELELALYTVCYLAFYDTKCKFTLNNHEITIITYTFFGPNQERFIGSAYPYF